jgi:Domain of unknown function (DUF4328)
MLCNRCGRAQPPDAPGPFCAHCGQFLISTRWVASPPDTPSTSGSSTSGPASAERPSGGYTGPPRYTETPQWGYPAQPWRTEAPEDSADPVDPIRRIELQAGLLVPLLRGLAVLAALSCAGEIWRYILLLQSRSGALEAGTVAASDALVTAASWVTTSTSVGVGAYLLFWVLRVSRASAARAGVRPSRGRRALLLGWLVPGLNLTVPGSTLAEVEHTALGSPAGERPEPSKLLRVWWGLWAANVLLGVVTVLWSLRSGVQAKADGVELHALVDLVVAVTAEVTARVVSRLTALMCPPAPAVRPIVVRVKEPTQTS